VNSSALRLRQSSHAAFWGAGPPLFQRA
jgi:hypothetical protein